MNASICATESKFQGHANNALPGKLQALISIKAIAVVTALFVVLPLLVIVISIFQPESNIWRHIVDTLLAGWLKNTFVLSLGVLAGTFLLGVGSAWLTAVCEFPGRSVFNWALVLPLAVPTYVMGFVFIGLLDFSGPVQSFLRGRLHSPLSWFPEIRSAGGVIFVMSLALFPYVYMLARNAFETQGKSVLEVSRILGHSPMKSFFKAALPMARPWIASGMLLVLMETLADFGAVSIFNYDTFTTGIYKAWFGFFSLTAAAQLSSVLLLFVFVVIVIEQRMRSSMQFHQVGRLSLASNRLKLYGWKKWAACVSLMSIVMVAFVIPCLQLMVWSLASITVELDSRYLGLLFRSLLFSAMAASLITALGLMLAYIQRRHDDFFTRWIIRFATLGYALPGTVLAVGIVIIINWADKPMVWLVRDIFGIELSSVLSGTVAAVLFAYTVRFLTAGFNTINSGMLRITRNMDEAAALMGIAGIKLLKRVHIPILKNGLFIAAMLVFVDVMKEMPMTLMTRPFGWDTLAIKVFELTSEGEWQRAALPSIALVAAGLMPLMLMNKKAGGSTI